MIYRGTLRSDACSRKMGLASRRAEYVHNRMAQAAAPGDGADIYDNWIFHYLWWEHKNLHGYRDTPFKPASVKLVWGDCRTIMKSVVAPKRRNDSDACTDAHDSLYLHVHATSTVSLFALH